MPIEGHRFVQERLKLCSWLESEKRKLGALPPEAYELKRQRELELERDFRSKLERLYGEGKHDPSATKLN